jgi:RHS repeat-associated protein
VKNLAYGNGINGAVTYNDHLQLSTLRYFNPAAPAGTPDVLNLSYDYGTSNNGQIQEMHYYTSPSVENTAKSETFTYDPWSRLSAAQTSRVDSTAGTWSLQWGYDRLGNRLQQKLAGGNISIGQPTFTIDASTNRIIGFTYDNAGNLTHDATAAYTYDGANRLTSVNNGSAVATYTYFGPLRIKKANGSTTTVYVYSGSKPIAEYVGGSVSNEYIYAGSTLLATLAGTGITYHHPDHLSNRAETDSSGNPVRSFGHFPYGETWYETSADQQKFTTYPRDSGVGESGLDYAMFRHYNSGQGRFTSADLLGGDLFAPQSLNQYSYVTGDPVNFFDPLGLCGKITVTTIEYDLNGKVKSKHTTVIDEGPCPPPSGGGGGGGVGGPPTPVGGPGGGPGVGPGPKKPDPKTKACAQAKAQLAQAQASQMGKVGTIAKETAAFGAAGAGAVGCVGGILGITYITDGIALASPGAEIGACVGGGAGTVVASAAEIVMATVLASGYTLIATEAEINHLQAVAQFACSQ